MCEFRIGQKVVCVDAGNSGDIRAGRWHGDAPDEGRVYTITDMILIEPHPLAPSASGVWLHFAEIRRSEWAREIWGPNVGYGARRFRPLVEPEADISIFRKMCVDATKRVSAE